MPSSATSYVNPFQPPSLTFPFGSPGSPSSPVLPSRPVSPLGGPAPSGTPGITSGGTDNSRLGGSIATIAPLLIGLLGSDNTASSKASAGSDQLTQMAKTLFGQGEDLSKMGESALGPVLKYLTAVAGGDPAALMQATMPERARLLDQYDTAKRNEQFSPRGGGQAGANARLETAQASQLATLPAEARRSGVSELASVGTSLTSAGAQTESAGASALNAAIQQQEQEAARHDAMWMQLATGLGKAAAAYFTGGASLALTGV